MPVLFERRGRYDGQTLGRSPFMQPVHAEAPERLIGTLATCRIVDVLNNSLKGEVLTVEAESAVDQPVAEKVRA